MPFFFMFFNLSMSFHLLCLFIFHCIFHYVLNSPFHVFSFCIFFHCFHFSFTLCLFPFFLFVLVRLRASQKSIIHNQKKKRSNIKRVVCCCVVAGRVFGCLEIGCDFVVGRVFGCLRNVMCFGNTPHIKFFGHAKLVQQQQTSCSSDTRKTSNNKNTLNFSDTRNTSSNTKISNTHRTTSSNKYTKQFHRHPKHVQHTKNTFRDPAAVPPIWVQIFPSSKNVNAGQEKHLR